MVKVVLANPPLTGSEHQDWVERAAIMWHEARDCYETEGVAEAEALRLVLVKRAIEPPELNKTEMTEKEHA